MTIILAKKGALFYVVILGNCLVVVMCTGLLVYTSPFIFIDQSGPPIFAILATLVMGGVAGWNLVSALTRSIEVGKHTFRDNGPLGKAVMQFVNCVNVSVLPAYGNTIFFGYNIMMYFTQNDGSTRGRLFSASIYSNRHQLVRAVIEAASLANSQVSIDFSLLRTYGKPPYGIFE